MTRNGRRWLTTGLIITTIALIALNKKIIGVKPEAVSREIAMQWLSRFTIFTCVIIFLAFLIILLAVKEVKAVLNDVSEEREKMLHDLINEFPKKSKVKDDRNSNA